MSGSKSIQKAYLNFKFPVKQGSKKERLLDIIPRARVSNLFESECRNIFEGDVARVCIARIYYPKHKAVVCSVNTSVDIEEESFKDFRDRVELMTKVLCKIMGISRAWYEINNPLTKYQCIKGEMERDEYIYGIRTI